MPRTPGGTHATGFGISQEELFRANGQDAGQVSHLPGSLGNPWSPLARITTSTD